MIHRTYGSFGELYRAELVSREFDVVGAKGDVILARYSGSSPLRSIDSNLEVRVMRKTGAIWELNADDRFYADRVHFNLGMAARMHVGERGGNAVYGDVKLFETYLLEEGKVRPKQEIKIIQPSNLVDVNLQLAIMRVREAFHNGFEVTTDGFSEEELRLFGLDSVRAA